MGEVLLIAGLGNPGEKYDNTRHNFGFQVVLALAQKHNCSFKRSSSINAFIAKIIDESIQVKKNNNEISSIVNFDSPLKNAREQFEREYLMHQLKKNGSNVSKTAENIGMERSALHRKLTSLGIAIK